MTEARLNMDGRLAYYGPAADANYWADHWSSSDLPEVHRRARNGDIRPLPDRIFRYIPKKGRVLEAGCGMGQVVAALETRGYQIEGIDWAQETIDEIHEHSPGLPVRTGDVRHIDVPDDHYIGYISLGVVEHFEDGPHVILEEAARVLAPGGIAVITVPHFNLTRRIKARFGLYSTDTKNLDFYQFAFKRDELVRLVEHHGFTVIETTGYDAVKGFAKELPVVRTIVSLPLIGSAMHRLMRAPVLESKLGHMQVVVARKD